MQGTTKPSPYPLMGVVTRQEQRLVTIKVGSEHQKYYLPHAFLCYHSDCFKGALNGTINLDDIKPSVFDIFVYWLYSQQLPATHDWPELGELSERTYEVKFGMVQAIVFADRFLVAKLRVAVCNALVNFGFDNGPPSFEAIIYAFAHLAAEHRILQMLIDVHCHTWDEENCSETDEENFSKLPVEFVKGVIGKYAGNDLCKRRQLEISLVRCHYHEYDTDVERVECEKKRAARLSDNIGLDYCIGVVI